MQDNNHHGSSLKLREFGIGELSERSRVPVASIRYYEEIGILPKAARRNSRHRIYEESDLARLTFVRANRELGFTLEQVRKLIQLSEPGNLTLFRSAGPFNGAVGHRAETHCRTEHDRSPTENAYCHVRISMFLRPCPELPCINCLALAHALVKRRIFCSILGQNSATTTRYVAMLIRACVHEAGLVRD